MTEYWLVSVPGEKTCQETWDRLNSATTEISTNFKFSIPDLKVGTLDQLVGLSDDLAKLDTYAETITRKLATYFAEVLEDQRDKLFENLQVQGKDLSHYLTKFQWDSAKYPMKQNLRNLTEIISKQVSQIDADLKTKATAYNNLKNNLSALERKATGGLLTKDLSDVVNKSDFVLNSEYLTTLLVVVPRLIFEDAENGLFSVTLFRKVVDEYKLHCRENKFIVREFVYDENALLQGKSERDKLAAEKNKQFAPLVRWLKINFSEIFSAWIHVKALRIFVESVLRYGLPVNFQAALLLPSKRSLMKKLQEVLNQLYSHLDVGNFGRADAKDEFAEMLSFGRHDYYPYVFFKISIDLAEPGKAK
ncbi:unnamed protein product [Soboliphyme baturini]|uniref:V-type proton ATPase subunit C n=1 Tax=Soboliphyme baturini TaxID=241478 RepID=A0A183IQF5_9BILA|nr:unnamed protein product [Soboliphyme baturini]